jgi:hypothetical protein
LSVAVSPLELAQAHPPAATTKAERHKAKPIIFLLRWAMEASGNERYHLD